MPTEHLPAMMLKYHWDRPWYLRGLLAPKNLMAVPMRKAHHFVFNGRAVTGPGAIDLAGIHGRTMEVGFDDIVGSRVGMSDVAINLRRSDLISHERKRSGWHVAWLSVQSSHLIVAPLRRGGVPVFNRSRAKPNRLKV